MDLSRLLIRLRYCPPQRLCIFANFLEPGDHRNFQFSSISARPHRHELSGISRVPGIIAWTFLDLVNLGRLPVETRYLSSQFNKFVFFCNFCDRGPWKVIVFLDFGQAPSLWIFRNISLFRDSSVKILGSSESGPIPHLNEVSPVAIRHFRIFGSFSTCGRGNVEFSSIPARNSCREFSAVFHFPRVAEWKFLYFVKQGRLAFQSILHFCDSRAVKISNYLRFRPGLTAADFPRCDIGNARFPVSQREHSWIWWIRIASSFERGIGRRNLTILHFFVSFPF